MEEDVGFGVPVSKYMEVTIYKMRTRKGNVSSATWLRYPPAYIAKQIDNHVWL